MLIELNEFVTIEIYNYWYISINYQIIERKYERKCWFLFTVVESPSDSSINLPSSASQGDIAAGNNNSKTSVADAQVSPTPSRQSRGMNLFV